MIWWKVYSFNRRINSKDFSVLFLCEWKIKHNASPAARNDNAAFKKGSVNERTIRRCYAKFESGDESLKNIDQGRPETVVNNEVLRTIVEKILGNIVRDYAEELGVCPTTIHVIQN